MSAGGLSKARFGRMDDSYVSSTSISLLSFGIQGQRGVLPRLSISGSIVRL